MAGLKQMKGRKKHGHKKLSHMVVKRASNGGYITEAHHERPEATKDMPYPDTPKPEEAAHADKPAMLAHLGSAFPDDEGGNGEDTDKDGE